MDPKEFAMLASGLLSQRSPAACRTMIGRAYYATFNVARQLLEKDFRVPESAGTHQQVINLLLASAKVNAIGSQLDTLKSLRNKADYRMKDVLPENYKTAEQWVTWADAKIVELRKILNGPERAQIVAEMKAWEAKLGPRLN